MNNPWNYRPVSQSLKYHTVTLMFTDNSAATALFVTSFPLHMWRHVLELPAGSLIRTFQLQGDGHFTNPVFSNWRADITQIKHVIYVKGLLLYPYLEAIPCISTYLLYTFATPGWSNTCPVWLEAIQSNWSECLSALPWETGNVCF